MGCGRGRNKAGDTDGADRKGLVKPCSKTGHSPEAWRPRENEALEGGDLHPDAEWVWIGGPREVRERQ